MVVLHPHLPHVGDDGVVGGVHDGILIPTDHDMSHIHPALSYIYPLVWLVMPPISVSQSSVVLMLLFAKL